MSGVRGIGDGYAFQRLLWLLVGTILLPTAVLTVFGVSAIGNQRAAIRQELDRQQGERLEIAAREVYALVEGVEERVQDYADGCLGADHCELTGPGIAESWSWSEGSAPPVALAALVSATSPEAGTTWFSPADGSSPVATFSRNGWSFAWRLDSGWLEDALQKRVHHALPEGVVVSLEGPSPGPATPLEEIMAQLDEDNPAALVLGRPLDRWRLLVDDAAVPTRAVLRRNAWLYPVSLAVLVGLVLVGTFVTLGSASREIRLSRLQTDFVSSVSHELRTPLTSIQLFVETLQSGRLDDDPQKVQECLNLLSLETDRLSRMIERTLDWARMEAGRRIYDMEPVRVGELIDDALRALRSQRLLAEDVDQIGVPDIPPGLHIHGDRDALVEALLNLLQNALKYTPPPRSIRVEVRVEGNWVGLAVADNGPGIASRERRRVFEKFYQADTRLSSPTQQGADRGSGLGLAIVRAVARAHRGRVDLTSEEGVGSTFTLWVRRVP